MSYDNGQFNYVYNYVDHLGNVRLSYTDVNQNNGNPVDLQIVQEKNYYPFGLTHQGYNTAVSSLGSDAAKKYLFGGKELQDENNLTWYDISARNYDPALGRWMNLDPLAEDMRRHSPYNFAFDNPIYFMDPDGMAPTDEWNKNADGSLTWISNKGGDETDYVNTLDADGNVTSTDTYDVEDNTTRSETSEMDFILKSPGSRNGVRGRGGAIEEGSILDIPFDVLSLAIEGIGEELGLSSGLVSAALIIGNPKKALKNLGRSGKQQRLKELATDPKLGRADKGWIKNEMRHIKNGNRRSIRNPGNSRRSKGRGKELAHPRGKRAKDGHSYKDAKLQDADLHKLEHKHGGY